MLVSCDRDKEEKEPFRIVMLTGDNRRWEPPPSPNSSAIDAVEAYVERKKKGGKEKGKESRFPSISSLLPKERHRDVAIESATEMVEEVDLRVIVGGKPIEESRHDAQHKKKEKKGGGSRYPLSSSIRGKGGLAAAAMTLTPSPSSACALCAKVDFTLALCAVPVRKEKKERKERVLSKPALPEKEWSALGGRMSGVVVEKYFRTRARCGVDRPRGKGKRKEEEGVFCFFVKKREAARLSPLATLIRHAASGSCSSTVCRQFCGRREGGRKKEGKEPSSSRLSCRKKKKNSAW